MKPLSPEGQRALQAYRQEHGVPPAVRARLLARLESARRAGQERTAPRAQGGALRLLRWAGPLALLVVGVGFSLRAGPRPPQAAPAAPRVVQLPVQSDAPRSTAAPATRAAASARAAVSSRRLREEPVVQRAAPRLSAPRKAPAALRELASSEHEGASVGRPAQTDDLAPSVVSEVAAQESEVAHGNRPAGDARPEQHAFYPPARDAERAPTAPRPALSFDDEVMLLRRVSDHLTHDDPMRALSAISEHARLFPHGKLVAMRQAARVRALCELGKRAQAEHEREQFLAQHGDSPYAAQVRRGCL